MVIHSVQSSLCFHPRNLKKKAPPLHGLETGIGILNRQEAKKDEARQQVEVLEPFEI